MLIKMTVNGKLYQLDVEEGEKLLDILRKRLLLTGTKECCREGECGACTVIMNGQAIRSCQVPAERANGAEILTVEGLAKGGKLDPIQQAFIDENVVQCGFCTPGMLMAAKALLMQDRPLSDEEIKKGMIHNICRCGSYPNVLRAIKRVNKDLVGG